ncbi:MAG: hypothetical protein RMJ53_10465 [Chitinophagales bacterium]|nr:hypothetical protein [Chitinophagales bacterium]MDW8274640.1 hypothetical protein [Chitinophagales bacterium]
MNEQTHLISAVRILIKWRTHIVGASLLAAIITALVAFFVLDEYYLSQSVFYPVNQQQSDRSVIFNTSSASTMNYFGDKNDVNRLLTMANSKELIEMIIDSFGLVEHYRINRNKPYWRTKVYKKFLKNYSAIKTEKDAIEISLLDTDPRLAATIVNTIVHILDIRNSSAIKENRARLIAALQSDIAEEEKKLNQLNLEADSVIRQHKLRVSYSQFGEIIIDGDNFLAREYVRQLFREINNTQREMLNKSNILRQIKVSVANSVSSVNIVEKAEPADKREKPKRTLLILTAFAIALVVSSFGAVIAEQIKEFRKHF